MFLLMQKNAILWFIGGVIYFFFELVLFCDLKIFQLARLQYAYPYKAIASLAVTLISAVATSQHKNLLYLIPVAIALPYLACETDATFGRRTARIKSEFPQSILFLKMFRYIIRHRKLEGCV